MGKDHKVSKPNQSKTARRRRRLAARAAEEFQTWTTTVTADVELDTGADPITFDCPDCGAPAGSPCTDTPDRTATADRRNERTAV